MFNFNFYRTNKKLFNSFGKITGRLLLSGVLVVTQMAYASDSPPPGSKFIGDGINSNVYQSGDQVTKIFKGGDAAAVTRDLMVDLVETVHNYVGKSVPPLTAVGSNSATQAFANGMRYSDLVTDADQMMADSLILKHLDAANRVLGDSAGIGTLGEDDYIIMNDRAVVVDKNPDNFRFTRTKLGTLEATWFDPVLVVPIDGGTDTPRPGTTPPPKSPIGLGPGNITVSTVASSTALKLGLGVSVADFMLGLSRTDNVVKYSLEYFAQLGVVAYGLNMAKVYLLPLLSSFAVRAGLGGIAAAIAAPWVGTAVVVGLTAISAYYFYDKLMNGQPVSVKSTDAVSAATGAHEANFGAIAKMASKLNGCVQNCNHDLYAANAQLFAEGVEIMELQDPENLTIEQAEKLKTLAVDYVNRANAHLANVNKLATQNVRIPDATPLQGLVRSVRRTTSYVHDRAGEGRLGLNTERGGYHGPIANLEFPPGIIIEEVFSIEFPWMGGYRLLAGQLKTGSGYWQDQRGRKAPTLCELYGREDADPCAKPENAELCQTEVKPK